MNPINASVIHGSRTLSAAILAAATLLFASTPPATAAEDEPTLFDDIWDLATLYKDDENPILQKFVFTGRAQGDYAYIDSDQGDLDEWYVRRLRAGFKASLFENFTLHAEADFDPQSGSPVYQRLTDAYLSWSPSPALEIKVGKQSAAFTLDGHTSSKELIAIDRSNLSNNLWFPAEYIPGVSVSGEIEHWHYFAGYYWSGEESPEFGDFNAGNFALITLGYDFADHLGVEEALLNFDYLYNKPDTGNDFTRSLRQVGSLNFFFEDGDFGFRSDVSVGDGYFGQDDIYGFLVMPFYNLTKKLQIVGRYTYVAGDNGANGVRLARYENEVVTGRGDNYNEFYAGVNYYLYGHKLKLQTGVTYAMMDDDANNGGAYNGWGLTSGIRVSW